MKYKVLKNGNSKFRLTLDHLQGQFFFCYIRKFWRCWLWCQEIWSCFRRNAHWCRFRKLWWFFCAVPWVLLERSMLSLTWLKSGWLYWKLWCTERVLWPMCSVLYGGWGGVNGLCRGDHWGNPCCDKFWFLNGCHCGRDWFFAIDEEQNVCWLLSSVAS